MMSLFWYMATSEIAENTISLKKWSEAAHLITPYCYVTWNGTAIFVKNCAKDGHKLCKFQRHRSSGSATIKNSWGGGYGLLHGRELNCRLNNKPAKSDKLPKTSCKTCWMFASFKPSRYRNTEIPIMDPPVLFMVTNLSHSFFWLHIWLRHGDAYCTLRLCLFTWLEGRH